MGAGGLAVLLLHGSNLGPMPPTVARLAIVVASAAAGLECAMGSGRVGGLLAAYTLAGYYLYVFPLALVPETPSVFFIFYLLLAAAIVGLVPLLLLRQRYALASTAVGAAAILWACLLP